MTYKTPSGKYICLRLYPGVEEEVRKYMEEHHVGSRNMTNVINELIVKGLRS